MLSFVIFLVWGAIGVIVTARCEARRYGVRVRDLAEIETSMTSSAAMVFILLWPIVPALYRSMAKHAE